MKKILIANRGEIAIRVIKTARKMGIKTVAVYSDADRHALHVRMADESYYIGSSPSAQSYLKGEVIIKTAKKAGADAIHPGYGFLSENAEFAEAVEKAGLVFIGPTSEAIRIMGSKLAAKDAVKKYDIPMVPGTDKAITDRKEAKEIAAKIGFPILIKASAGGGGKGMRIVENESSFEENLNMAISEATSAFGDGSVFIEKYVTGPRHIEFQIMADNYGNTVHLFERECSIQRRHQKVVEEAPSAVLDEALRNKMGDAAVNVAKSCGYRGAGTVEFLLDADRNFYFLEMNTRLQVEHPVTEKITGLDLVEWQIKVARGEKLPLNQEEIKINGHSIELRVYAEDAFDNFLPSIDTLSVYRLPEGKDIRVDNGYEEGQTIPIFYDPMISKLITYGENRETAIQRMKEAISAYLIEGIESTLEFGYYVMDHPAFQSGDFDTHFVKKYWSKEKYEEKNRDKKEALANFILKYQEDIAKKILVPN